MARRRRQAAVARTRFTVDASVFVNAFNPHERGHAASRQFLTVLAEHEHAIVIPSLALPEIASALARATDDTAGAMAYVDAIAGLPHLTIAVLTPALARQAADLAATYRVRGADAVYLGAAQRYAAVLVTRDEEQRARGAEVVTCLTPDQAIA